MRIAGVLYMKTTDNESFILELFNLIPLSKCVINGNSSKCKNVYKLIKKYKDWIDSSSKKDLPPDFYSDKYKIMMEIMSINDVEYNDDNRIINEQMKRQHELLSNLFGDDYKKEGNDLSIIMNYDNNIDNHNMNSYKSSFKRIIEKHKEKIENYKNNHKNYELVFFVFDNAPAYYCEQDGKTLVHVPFNDKYFVELIKNLNVDYVVWFTSNKNIWNSKGKYIKLPVAGIYDVINTDDKYIDYDAYELKPYKYEIK